jgi:hypothetical protein
VPLACASHDPTPPLFAKAHSDANASLHGGLLVRLKCCSLPVLTLAQQPDPQNAELKLTDVIAYSAGVGFVSFTGEVNDNAVFRIATSTAELDDLLKSLVVLRASGTATINVPNDVAQEEPIRIVQAETVGEILQSLRGESVSLNFSVSDTVQGRVLAVELRSMLEGNELVDREVVSLLTEHGIVSVPLKDVLTVGR